MCPLFRAAWQMATKPCVTSPAPSLKFRTAGFPQYGFKAGLSGGACPHDAHVLRRTVCLHPSCSPQQGCTLRSESEQPARWNTAVRAACAALPQGPSLRSGLFCPGPSSLNRPHPPHSPAQRHFAGLRFIGVVFAVPAGLGDRRVVPCFRWLFFLGMSSSMTPGNPSAAFAQFFAHRWRWPSSLPDRLGVSNTPTIRFRWAPVFEVALVRFRYDLSSCLPLWRIRHGLSRVDNPLSFELLGRSPSSHQADRGFYFRASDRSVAVPAAGYDYGGN